MHKCKSMHCKSNINSIEVENWKLKLSININCSTTENDNYKRKKKVEEKPFYIKEKLENEIY